MSDDVLYQLLPAVYRARDLQSGETLRTLLGVFETVYVQLERDIGRLYDDFFVETCRTELLPLIGDLVGTELPGEPPLPETVRRYVADYRRYRRFTGQLAVTRDVAADMTGWPCHAVDGGRMLVTSPDLRRPTPAAGGFDGGDDRLDGPRAGAIDIRREADLPWLRTPFDPVPRAVDIRQAATVMPPRAMGHHDLGRLELYLFRLFVQPLEWIEVPPSAWPDGAMGYQLDPLGRRQPLFNGLRPLGPTMDRDTAPIALDVAALAEALVRAGDDPTRSPVRVALDYSTVPGKASSVELLPRDIGARCLDPWPDAWPVANADAPLALVDPVAGRMLVRTEGRVGYPVRVRATFSAASPAAIGGGSYRGARPRLADDGVDWLDVWQVGTWPAGTTLATTDPRARRLELRRRFGYQDDTDRPDMPDRPGLAWLPIDPADLTDPYAVDQRAALAAPLRFASLADALDWYGTLAALDQSVPPPGTTDRAAGGDLKYRRMQRAGVRIEIVGSTCEQIRSATVAAWGRPLAIYARPGARPTIRGLLDVQTARRTRIDIDGVLWGGAIRGSGDVRMTLRDCTLRPMPVTLAESDLPPGALRDSPDAAAVLTLVRSIVGRVRVGRSRGRLVAVDSAIDSASPAASTHQPADAPDWAAPNPELRIGLGDPGLAYADVFDERAPGADAALTRVTLFGRTAARQLEARDTLFQGPVRVIEQDIGELDHCYVPLGSHTPRRVRCAEQARGVAPPRFLATDPADPRFALLDGSDDPRVLEGSVEGAEIGVYAGLEVPRRLRQLRAALIRFLPLTYQTELILVADSGRGPPAAGEGDTR